MARRSTGAGQAAGIRGNNYSKTVNDNMLVVVMIETPMDVRSERVFRLPQTDDRYWGLVQKVHDDVVRAGKIARPSSVRIREQ